MSQKMISLSLHPSNEVVYVNRKYIVRVQAHSQDPSLSWVSTVGDGGYPLTVHGTAENIADHI